MKNAGEEEDKKRKKRERKKQQQDSEKKKVKKEKRFWCLKIIKRDTYLKDTNLILLLKISRETMDYC